MRQIPIVATALALFIAPVFAQDKASQKFLTEAIEGNFAEVQMGELAQKNGQSSEVKSYGQMLATDHNAANQKAMEAAKSLGVNAPAGMPSKRPITTIWPDDWSGIRQNVRPAYGRGP